MKNAHRVLALLIAGLVLLAGCNSNTTGSSSQGSSYLSETSSDEMNSEGTDSEYSESTDSTLDSSLGTTNSQTVSKPSSQSGVSSSKTSSVASASSATSSTTPTKNYALKQSDFISNSKIWSTPMLRNEGFQFLIEMGYATAYNTTMIKNSIKKYDMGEYMSALPATRAAEWGYSITHLDGQVDGAGNKISTGFAGADAPKTREEAVTKMKAFLQKQYIKGAAHPWESMNGHYPWHHYAGEFGFDVLSSEIGESINNYQWHIALNRGAAKQYQTPWTIDFSNWHGPSIADVSGTAIWGVNSDPKGGHSNNLMERAFVMSYMSGADSIIAEGGALLSFYTTLSNGAYKISPYGQTCKDFYDFTKTLPDPGIAYTPIAVVLDYYHGAYSGFDGKKAFFNFNYTAGDNMTWDLIDMIWPTGWEVMGRNEVGTMVNGPYGDNFDILLQNASQEVLNSYPALLLSGDIKLSSSEISRYKKYVEQGGTLILNTAYLTFFPEFKGTLDANSRYNKTYGKGKVIVYGGDYQVTKLDPILKEVIAENQPFTVSNNIQYITSIKDGTMYVTLINNDGVTKAPKSTVQIDTTKKKAVTVQYDGNLAIKSVKNVYGSTAIKQSGKNVSVTVPAGGIVILEYRFD